MVLKLSLALCGPHTESIEAAGIFSSRLLSSRTWLPWVRASRHPLRFKARTASVPVPASGAASTNLARSRL
jgi:hypothetical protein